MGGEKCHALPKEYIQHVSSIVKSYLLFVESPS